MEDKVNIEDLPQEQQEYVKEYQRILHGLADVQEGIKALQDKANSLVEELNTLRAKERAEFGEDNIL
jgi:predicted  nucleic acid-binding Zn-ribbon protein